MTGVDPGARRPGIFEGLPRVAYRF
ncbi:MAG: hypothetical protein JWM40_2158, partial [Frankiales bacterium]|nr:hypothetical protein [Frankiales bacterium]